MEDNSTSGDLFKQLDAAKAKGEDTSDIQAKIDNYETHVVPIVADIDAGFGNEEATYLLAKKMIEAGACCIQIENQVSDEKQCGHQDGKVTVPHADFLAKIRAVRGISRCLREIPENLRFSADFGARTWRVIFGFGVTDFRLG